MDWVIDIRHEWLTPIFKGFSFVGSETFFLILLPFGYWFLDKAAFARFGVLLLLSVLLNAYLKAVWQLPRPDDVEWLVATTGWSFPSGHAQVAAAIWPWLAYESGRRRAYLPAAVLVAGIAFSRVYLGVHYPIDVIVGVGIGLASGALFLAATHRTPDLWRELKPHLKVGLVFAIGVAWLEIFPGGMDRNALKAAATLAGLAAAMVYEPRLVGFRERAGPGQQALKLVVGVAGLVAILVGLKLAVAAAGLASEPADFGRYLLVGLWVGWFAPWLFARAGWQRPPVAS